MTRPTHVSMRRLARVDSYRGFVFASQSAEGPALEDFLGGVRSSIDNLATARRWARWRWPAACSA